MLGGDAAANVASSHDLQVGKNFIGYLNLIGLN